MKKTKHIAILILVLSILSCNNAKDEKSDIVVVTSSDTDRIFKYAPANMIKGFEEDQDLKKFTYSILVGYDKLSKIGKDDYKLIVILDARRKPDEPQAPNIVKFKESFTNKGRVLVFSALRHNYLPEDYADIPTSVSKTQVDTITTASTSTNSDFWHLRDSSVRDLMKRKLRLFGDL